MQPFQSPPAAIHRLVGQVFPDEVEGIERVREGVSTEVYRIRRRDAVFYLRILPEQDASFAPEAVVHGMLRGRCLHVPEIVCFEHCHPELGRSAMITTEIAGEAVGYGTPPPGMRAVLIDAGRELAAINGVGVEGFGWIRRDGDEPDTLRAEYATYSDWLHRELDAAVATLARSRILHRRDVEAIHEVMEEATSLFDGKPAYLAHGDFDVTHIYHQHGVYSGIIDFGEIRGTNRLYDLGHFSIENGDSLADLLAGYADMAPLPPDALRRIRISGLLIATRRLSRGIVKRPTAIHFPDRDAIERLLRELQT